MEKIIDKRLSHSSANLLKNCEKRYFHYKVAKTPIDPDASDTTDAFNIGKAFHGVLEDMNHEYRSENIIEELCKMHCSKNECVGEEPLIEAMIKKYLHLHKMTGLRCVFCEYEIRTDIYLGYIDAIMMDSSGGWWIVDLKTASKVSPSLLSRLRHDTQLNLYASYYEDIAKNLELDPNKFMGMRYRVTTKPKLVRKTSESYEKYVSRLISSTKSYDIEIPKNSRIMQEVRVRHQKLWLRSEELRNGEEPTSNYTYCESYYRPCPYWSQCYEDTYTNCEKKLILKDADTYQQEIDCL